MPDIYFRTDGNEEIAIGHIMRCLSIARACRDLHAAACFLVSDEKSTAVLKECFTSPDEFPIQCLHSDYRDLEAGLSSLQYILDNSSSDVHSTNVPIFFIDSYFVTEAYLSELRKFCRTAYIDDMLLFDYPVDLVVNYDILSAGVSAQACYHKANRRLLGADYTPLREQFQDVPYEVRREARNILISTGSTDKYNLAGELLKKVFSAQSASDLQKCRYHVITSRLNSCFQTLEQLALMYPAIHIHENVHDMAALMSLCDLGVSAGGTTLSELCAVGVPSVSFASADNQLNAVNGFSSKGIIPYAGNARLSPTDVIAAIILFLENNINSYENRQKASQNMRAFIDGRGSARIASALISLLNP